MAKLFTLLALLRGKPLITGGCPHEEPVMRNFDDFFVLIWTSCWANSGIAADFRRYVANVTSLY